MRQVTDCFRDILKSLIDRKYPSRRAFIRVTDPGGNENPKQSYLAKVISGERPPPMDRIDAWATALDLAGPALVRFRRLAAIAHLPDDVQPEFVKIIDGFERQNRMLDELETRMRAAESSAQYDDPAPPAPGSNRALKRR